jgi:Pyridoxamine 5'-phosphate oxidase
VRWNDLQRDAAGLALIAHERLIALGVLLVATIRRDGTPRLSPVEPLIFDGDLHLSMMWRSHKASDLLRDNRVLVHSVVTTRDGTEGEVKLRGRAISVEDLEMRARASAMRRVETSTSHGGPAEPSSSGERLVRPASGHRSS